MDGCPEKQGFDSLSADSRKIVIFECAGYFLFNLISGFRKLFSILEDWKAADTPVLELDLVDNHEGSAVRLA